MRNGRAVDWDNPLLGHGRLSPCERLRPDPRTTSETAVMVPRKQAGHMTCTRPQAERQILLATRASSTHDPEQKSQTKVRTSDTEHKPTKSRGQEFESLDANFFSVEL